MATYGIPKLLGLWGIFGPRCVASMASFSCCHASRRGSDRDELRSRGSSSRAEGQCQARAPRGAAWSWGRLMNWDSKSIKMYKMYIKCIKWKNHENPSLPWDNDLKMWWVCHNNLCYIVYRRVTAMYPPVISNIAIEQFQKTMLTFLLPLKSLSRLLLRLFCGLRFGFREGTCFLFSFCGAFAATGFAGVFAFAELSRLITKGS